MKLYEIFVLYKDLFFYNFCLEDPGAPARLSDLLYNLFNAIIFFFMPISRF